MTWWKDTHRTALRLLRPQQLDPDLLGIWGNPVVYIHVNDAYGHAFAGNCFPRIANMSSQLPILIPLDTEYLSSTTSVIETACQLRVLALAERVKCKTRMMAWSSQCYAIWQ